jgi:hypothetical protein
MNWRSRTNVKDLFRTILGEFHEPIRIDWTQWDPEDEDISVFTARRYGNYNMLIELLYTSRRVSVFGYIFPRGGCFDNPTIILDERRGREIYLPYSEAPNIAIAGKILADRSRRTTSRFH